MNFRPIFSAFIIVLATLSMAAQERFLKPVDEAEKDPTFVAFRSQLTKAVAGKDAKFIRSILAKDVLVNFGGANGVSGFLEEWKNLGPTSEFWSKFGWAISHGGKFEKVKGSPTQFWAPYTYASFPNDLDGSDYGTVVGVRIRLRKAASPDAEIVGYLSYNLVKPYIDATEVEGWMEVVTAGGKRGFIAAEFFHSPMDYRAGFEKVKGAWKLKYFVSGD